MPKDSKDSPSPRAESRLNHPLLLGMIIGLLLGIVISLPNGRCPSGHTYVPAHEECLGEFAANSACAELGPVPMELELCRCVWHSGPWVSFSSCECRAAGTMGFVTQGHTVECH